MIPEQFKQLIDPRSGEDLVLCDVVLENGHVRSGRLVCRTSAVAYPVREFIPSFVEDQGYTENFGLQWVKHAHVQLDSYNRSTYSRDRLYATTGWSSKSRFDNQTILEAGSGAGRFTEILAATGAHVFSFDFSEAVRANLTNNGSMRNVAILQADIYHPPFRQKTFDKVLCMGVLQHTPDVKQAFMSLARMVRPGGQLIVDIYPKIWRQLLHWKYLLRPFTTHLHPQTLYRCIRWYVPKLMPLSRLLYQLGGKTLRRLVPVMDQTDKVVSPEIRCEWAILDTYDALSARYDKPQTAATLESWYKAAGFVVEKYDVQGFPLVGIAPSIMVDNH